VRAHILRALVALLAVVACDETSAARFERTGKTDREWAQWNGPCSDESYLLATTSGSPNSHKCTNHLHRMRVQIASAPSHEEFGAVVFCECRLDADGGTK
jgi:hypothetical protein